MPIVFVDAPPADAATNKLVALLYGLRSTQDGDE